MVSKTRKQMEQVDIEQVTGSSEKSQADREFDQPHHGHGYPEHAAATPAYSFGGDTADFARGDKLRFAAGGVLPVRQVPHVYQAIRDVIVALSKTGIAKDKKNTEQNFVFRSIDAFLSALSVELPKAGLVILPRVVGREVIRTETADKKVTTTVYLEVEYTLVSTVDGSAHAVKFCGEGRDRADKAANKATSGAYKYMAIQTFCVPVVGQEDPDSESPEEGGEGQSERKRAPRAEASSAPAAQPVAAKAAGNPVEEKLVALVRNEVDRKKLREKLLDAYGVMVVADIPADRQEEAVGKIVTYVAAQQARKRD